MSNRTGISWTDRTWNPVVGCTKVSQGCKNCYAKTLHDQRHKALLEGKLQAPQYREPFETVQLMPDRLAAPLRWREPSRVFVNSVSDLFHDDVPFEFILLVFAMMAGAPQHQLQILTKRPQRMLDFFTWVASHKHKWPAWVQMREAANNYFCGVSIAEGRRRGSSAYHRSREVNDRTPWPMPNVWLGVSVEHQDAANERIALLLQTPAAHRFVSCEPLLGAVDLTAVRHYVAEDSFVTFNALERGSFTQWSDAAIDVVIVGGESGSRKQHVRPMHPDWAFSLRDQTIVARAEFEFKQWGDWVSAAARAFGTARASDICVIDRNGARLDPSPHDDDADVVAMVRVGTKRAGRDLGGRTYDASWAVGQ